MGFIAGHSSQLPSNSHCKHLFFICFTLIYAIAPVMKCISNKIEIFMKRKIGRKSVEIINKPAPIPIEVFVRIFRNLYLVNPKMFKTIGIKNANERKNIIKRLVNVSLMNVIMNRIVTPTVG